MKKKIVSALLCVAMAASLVVGCGSKSGSDSWKQQRWGQTCILGYVE